jgi:hypothetical protein
VRQRVQEAFAALRGLGTVEELKALAHTAPASKLPPKSNTHIHLPPLACAGGQAISEEFKAIYYLMERKYETGQALPVSGGQVMLS